MPGMTPERAEALRVARAALLGPASSHGHADAIVTALHHAGLLAPQHTGLSVWWVWEEDGPVRGLYATKAAAEQGTIEVYEEMEGHCPDYSWPCSPAGIRELAAGGEPTGIYLARRRVLGQPAEPEPIDQLREQRDAFADRVDTLTAVAKGNQQHVFDLMGDLSTAQREVDAHLRHAAALLKQLRAAEAAAALVTEYRVPVGPDCTDWLLVRREPTGDRWAILAGRRSSGNRMAWVGDRWQALPVTGPVGLWEYESAVAALDAATALAEQMTAGGERP